MTRKFLPLALLVGAILVSISSQARTPTAPMTLKSVQVSLPESSARFPSGPGADVANNNCLGCHSVGMVLNQPNLPKAGWDVEVNKMRNVYKAPVDAKDVPALVDYLTSIKGTK